MRSLIFLLLVVTIIKASPLHHKGTVGDTLDAFGSLHSSSLCSQPENTHFVQEVCIGKIEMDYLLSTIVGEPTKKAEVTWYIYPLVKLKNGTDLMFESMSPEVKHYFLKLVPMYPTQFVTTIEYSDGRTYSAGKVVFDGGALGVSGDKSFNVTGSPQWDRFITSESGFPISICNKLRNNTDLQYYGKSTTINILKEKIYLTDLQVCNLEFSGITDLDRAIGQDCSWKGTRSKQECQQKKQKEKEDIEELDRLLSEASNDRKVSTSSDFDIFDDTPASKSKDNLDPFDELETVVGKQQKQQQDTDWKKRIYPFKQRLSSDIQSCKNGRPQQPGETFGCERKHTFESYCGKPSKTGGSRICFPSIVYTETEAEYKNRCQAEKIEWQRYKANYSNILKKWEDKRDQCIDRANSTYRQAIKDLKKHEKSIEEDLGL